MISRSSGKLMTNVNIIFCYIKILQLLLQSDWNLLIIYSHEGILSLVQFFNLIILLDCDNWELIVFHEGMKDTSLKSFE